MSPAELQTCKCPNQFELAEVIVDLVPTKQATTNISDILPTPEKSKASPKIRSACLRQATHCLRKSPVHPPTWAVHFDFLDTWTTVCVAKAALIELQLT